MLCLMLVANLLRLDDVVAFSYLFCFCIQRENAVDDFRAGKIWVLIATDVIARGMDFKGVNCVINYDFPDSAAAYIHRIGMFAQPPISIFDSSETSNGR